MAEKSVRGRFVWHELMTPDTAGAHAFYSKVLGWKTQPFEHDPSYSMFAASSGPLGGSVATPSGAPHWLPYVGTPDIDATVQQARGLGGSVTTDVTSIPNGGRYAVLKDPQGAAFGVYQSTQDAVKETAPKRGEFSWHELATTDHKAAFDFYSQLFGWETQQEHDMGPMGVYRIFGSNGVMRGGMMNKPPEMQGGPTWLGYVRVKSVDDAVKKVKSARGTLINGPMEVPGGDWIAQFLDPHGAMFAVHALAADVKAASGSATAASSASAPAAQAAAAPAAEPAAPKKAASPAKKATKKKAAPTKKKAAKKKRSAAKAAKRPARKAGKKKAGRKVAKKRAGGKKKAASKSRRKK
jgi:predicted enzyme related to lactoylglutathione lyase